MLRIIKSQWWINGCVLYNPFNSSVHSTMYNKMLGKNALPIANYKKKKKKTTFSTFLDKKESENHKCKF